MQNTELDTKKILERESRFIISEMLFVGLYLVIALFIIFMIFLEKRENKIVDKYKKWKEENLNDE